MFMKIVRVVTTIVLQTKQWIQEAIQIPRFPKSTFLSHGTKHIYEEQYCIGALRYH